MWPEVWLARQVHIVDGDFRDYRRNAVIKSSDLWADHF